MKHIHQSSQHQHKDGGGGPTIHVQNLRKLYMIHERNAGLQASVRSLVRRQSKAIHAVDGVTFDVAPGEVVGFLGPNGAGKTTTIKMLTGLLHPTSGVVSVLGHTPSRREKAFLRQVTLIAGQRNQLFWDIPASDSFELNRVIYRIPSEQYRTTLAELTELLELGPLLRKPVRNLSLGERMKCEFAAALLHRPRLLFLDEPTIGLDVTMQRRIRTFIAEYNYRFEATVLLTSHYMNDVEALCRRVIIIHHGEILFDGNLAQLMQRFATYKTIVIDLDDTTADLGQYGEVLSRTESQATFRVAKAEVAQVAAQLLANLPVTDLTIEEPPIDEVIEQVFSKEVL